MSLRGKVSLGGAVLVCILTAVSAGQTSAPAADTKPKADIIFVHANVYTGVPANSQFASIERQEAIAVKGDRILAVGKTLDMDKFKGPQTKIVDLIVGELDAGGDGRDHGPEDVNEIRPGRYPDADVAHLIPSFGR